MIALLAAACVATPCPVPAFKCIAAPCPLHLPADIVDHALPRFRDDIPDSDFVTPGSVGLPSLDDRGIEVYLPSLTMAASGETLRKHATVVKIKARYKTTGVFTRDLCWKKCDGMGLQIAAGTQGYKTRTNVDGTMTDTWCTVTTYPSKCVYPEDKKRFYASSNHMLAGPMFPLLDTPMNAQPSSTLVTVWGPLGFEEKKADFGGDMVIAVLFEDFDTKEADVQIVVYGLGAYTITRPPELRRAGDGSVTLALGGRTVQLTEGATKDEARVEVLP